MTPRLLVLMLLLAGGSVSVWPQLIGFPNLKVRVTTTDDRPAPKQLRVELVTSSELYVSTAYTDDEGNAEFAAAPGLYRLRVSGMQIDEVVTSVFAIHRSDTTSFQNVRVALEGAGKAETKAASSTISRASLNIPAKAQKEYDKGGKAMMDGYFSEARARLEKAIVLYPEFAAAYNDLGVVFMNTGEKQKGRAAFEKAVEIDPNYGRAYRNLAILKLSEGNAAEAMPLAEKALASDPLDPQALLVMAQICFQTGKMEDAVKHARKVHDLPHEGFAAAHLIAARALEAQNLRDQAAAEYRLFLSEAPNSASAPKVRATLERLTAKTN